MKNKEFAEELVKRLNGLCQSGTVRECLEQLLNVRIGVSKAIADHETLQVSGAYEEPTLGMLGALNGLTGITEDGTGLIQAVYQKPDGKPPFLSGFKMTLGVPQEEVDG